jgi:hypothetical protein
VRRAPGTIAGIAPLRHDAFEAQLAGVRIVLSRNLWDPARVQQEAREESDPWDDVLAKTVGTVEQDEERVSSADLLNIVLGIHISKQRDFDYKRLGRCMRRLGWDGPRIVRISGEPTKGYSRPLNERR